MTGQILYFKAKIWSPLPLCCPNRSRAWTNQGVIDPRAQAGDPRPQVQGWGRERKELDRENFSAQTFPG